MNKLLYLIPIIVGIGLTSLAIAPTVTQQEAFATAYGGSPSVDGTANPSGLSQANMTGNLTETENTTIANPVGDNEILTLGKDNPSQVPIG